MPEIYRIAEPEEVQKIVLERMRHDPGFYWIPRPIYIRDHKAELLTKHSPRSEDANT